jgi:type IV secretion system protein VirB9
MKKLALLFIVCGNFFFPSYGQDSRIRVETYDKTRVYDVHTASGRATLIQLEEDESLVVSPSSVLGIGDADAWNLGVRGNNIVLKPSQKMPQTNVVVVTNKRTYSFELLDTPHGNLPTYILRFYYPDTEAAKQRAEALVRQNEVMAARAEAALEAKRLQITEASRAEKVSINTEYFWRGDNALLKPTAAYDDGRFTRLIYDTAADLPIFYEILPDGTESLMNYNVEPNQRNIVQLHKVIRVIRVRLGNDVIEITNKNYVAPKFNGTGTSVQGAVRIEKGQP